MPAGPPGPEEPTSTGDTIRFALHDPAGALTAVRVLQDVARPRDEPVLQRGRDDTWIAEWPRPPVDRLEYRLRLERADGSTQDVPDPAVPARASGPFGDRSVLELPGYSPPRWLDARDGGSLQWYPLPSEVLGAVVHVGIWEPPGTDGDSPLPLLVAHDGPELAEHGGLLSFCSWAVAAGDLPPLRVALLGPEHRDEIYSASPSYARAMAREVWPLLEWLAPRQGRPCVGLGASLGALAALHLHSTRPDLLDGLFLQSGSFFRRASDARESGFDRFRRISRFVGDVLAGRRVVRPVPMTLTCGTVEENLENNRAFAQALRGHGVPVEVVETRDAHNWVAWRDTWDPHLVDLVRRAVAA